MKRLDQYLHLWQIFKQTGHFPDPSSDGLRIIADVWQETFKKTPEERHKQLSCGGCIKDMLRQIFNHYENELKHGKGRKTS